MIGRLLSFRFGWALLVAGLLLLPPAGAAHAQAAGCAEPVARLVSAQGPVEVERGAALLPVVLDATLCRGDVIRVGPNGRAALALADGGTLRLDQNTTCRVGEEPDRSVLDLFFGALHFLSRTTRALEVSTPFVNAAVEGTEFVLRVLPDRALLGVYEGRVAFANPQGRLLVEDGQSAVAVEGRAPVLRVVVRPLEAVQWALYYPPVLTPLAAPEQARGLPPALAEAVEAVAAGDLTAAFAHLEAVPEAERDAAYHTLLAGLLLSVGRAEEARAAIGRARAQAPGEAEPLALGAVVAVAQNDVRRALAEARRAAELEPGSAEAALALSYALQAAFELEEARRVLRAAVERHPRNPLLRARLAELSLALGEVRAAREQAEAAVEVGPESARAHAVRGFVALARLDTGAAADAFRRAIQLEPDAPLPHLGLGLALIRRNELEEGRWQIEIAAGLDPNDALLRAYLGKAYFEERRDEAAAEELALAQTLDPLDPTAFFYDAIREQLANRPVEALRDLERAIALNENRAVYRSRLLLEEDVAARTVSLARIYDDLGFEQLAVTEAATSLNRAPASFSAHRFLADSYAELPRHEIARASELLQAQLLQPLGAGPVSPRLAVSDLNVIAGGGPVEVGFNEFTPLFTRERPQLLASGLVGDDRTLADEVLLSGLWRRFGYSLAQFHSETEGFRRNNDIENDLYDAFAQVAVTPRLSLQAEYRHRETEQGDLQLRFDPQLLFENRREVRQEAARAGLHWAPAPGSDVIASLIYADREEDLDVVFGGQRLNQVFVGDEGFQGEAQYIFQSDPVSVRAGVGAYDIDAELRTRPVGFPASEQDFERKQQTAYAYTYLNLLPRVTATVGLGYDHFEEDGFGLDVEKVSPKFGLEVAITDDLLLRAVAMRTVKRALVVNQTIEPTEVAGFNQFFDDPNGTVAERYGIGLDARLADGLYAGVEASRRELDFPLTVPGAEGAIEERREDLYRGYVYWAPHPRWAFSTEARLDDFERNGVAVDPISPLELQTIAVSLAARYFYPSGFYAEFGPTYVNQDLDRQADVFLTGDEDFIVLDATLGYRLPNRRGAASLEVRNLLDEEFRFQDDNFRSVEERVPRFIPDRTILARLTLSF